VGALACTAASDIETQSSVRKNCPRNASDIFPIYVHTPIAKFYMREPVRGIYPRYRLPAPYICVEFEKRES